MTDLSTATDSPDLGTLVNQASGNRELSSVVADLDKVKKLREQEAKDPAVVATRAKNAKTLDEDEEATRSAFRDVPKFNPGPAPSEQQTDPIKAFGSLGSVFGIMASAFTHQPWANTMNAAAAGINAVRANDREGYESAYKAWKDNYELLKQRHDMAHEAATDAMTLWKQDPAAGDAKLRSVAAQYEDPMAQILLEAGQHEKLFDLYQKRDETMQGMDEKRESLRMLKAQNDLKFEGSAAAKVADTATVQRVQKQLAMLQQTAASTTAASKLTPQASFMQQKMAERDAAGLPTTSQDIEDDLADFNKKTKVAGKQSPLQEFMAARQADAEKGGTPWDSKAIESAYGEWSQQTKGGEPLTPEGIDYAATIYRDKGLLPSLGIGGVGDRERVINRAAQLAGESGSNAGADVARQKQITANAQALTSLEKTRANVENFEGTAAKEADLALSLAPKGEAGKRPVLNRWIQAGRKDIQGDADVSAFDTALTSFKNEYARIMSSPGATGGPTSDAARHEAEGLINDAQSPAQLIKNFATMKKSMQNRIDAIKEAETDLVGRLQGLSGGGKSLAVPTGVIRYDKDGNRVQ